jgi:perosamine synthetase
MKSSLYGPPPRLRTYTRVRQYALVLARTLSAQNNSGDALLRFRRIFREKFDCHTIPMPMARTGIYLTLKALIQPGQEVILSPYTIAEVVNMVICAGGIPVFADLDTDTCNISAKEIERLIGDNTGAVLVTHFYGLVCDMPRIRSVCNDRNIYLIEDAAQAFGATISGTPAGSFGDAGIFSFGLYKNINAFMGGMVITANDDLKMRLETDLANLPIQPLGAYLKKVMGGLLTDLVTFPPLFGGLFFWIFRFGFLNDVDAINSKLKIDTAPILKSDMPAEYLHQMSSVQAELVLMQMADTEKHKAGRISLAELYHAGLNDIAELILPPRRTDGSHIYWYYPIQAPDRHSLVEYAMRHFCDITESYHRNCAALPCFAEWNRECPNAERTANSVIYLPTYPGYPKESVDENIRVIRSFYGV